jgi:hypothetical protein
VVVHARGGWRWSVWLGAAVLAGCAGVFQHARPAVPMHYERVVQVADGELRVGAAERDVTPAIGGYLAGFSLGRTSNRIASNLAVRALVIETAARRFAIVGIDNLGVMREDVDWIKSGLPGFANADVFVCASHTHAGPDLIGLWGAWLWTTGRDRDYLTRVREAVAGAVAAAREAAAPARFVHGRGRLPEAGLVKNSNRPFVFDRRVEVLAALALDDGRPLGTLLHFACHPVVLPRGNRAISADFVGELCDEWRRRGHGQAVFVNGALGAMISPAKRSRDERGMRSFGDEACDVCERALAAAGPLPVPVIEVRRRDVYLPLTTLGFRLGRLTGVLQRELFAGDARSTVGYLRLGAFEAITVPGEMEPALAETIRGDLLRPDLVVFGLCDDEVGYLLRRQEATDPLYRYERSMSPCRDAGELVRAVLRGAPAPR